MYTFKFSDSYGKFYTYFGLIFSHIHTNASIFIKWKCVRCSIACSYMASFCRRKFLSQFLFLECSRKTIISVFGERDEERVVLSWLQVTKDRTWTKYVRRKATKFDLTPSLLSHPFVVFLFVQFILDLCGGVPRKKEHKENNACHPNPSLYFKHNPNI